MRAGWAEAKRACFRRRPRARGCRGPEIPRPPVEACSGPGSVGGVAGSLGRRS
jgi:hypothetical protein